MADTNNDARRRLAILVRLSLMLRYKEPLPDLAEAVGAVGYPASMAAFRADADWLQETGLAFFDRANDTLAATERGLDVAAGTAQASGVARPRPGA